MHWQNSAVMMMSLVRQFENRLDGKEREKMRELNARLERKERLAMYEVNDIEKAYEKIMRSFNQPAVTVKHDIDTRLKLRH